MGEDQFRVRALILAEASEVQEIAGRLSLVELSARAGTSIPEVREVLDTLEALGLMISGLREDEEPLVLRAGHQYLELRGEIDDATLAFLGNTIDDVHARAAIAQAGAGLVGRFRRAVLDGQAVAHARGLVPPGFVDRVDEALAVDLYSAAVALMTRLSDARPPGCLAEEIVAVRVVEAARERLERGGPDELDPAVRARAIKELRTLTGLFHDDTAIELFRLGKTADAAVDAWFEPFEGTVPTGYRGAAA